MFECYCSMIVEGGDCVDRLAILSFDRNEANVVTSTDHHKLTDGCEVSVNAEDGIVRFYDVDHEFVTILVPDERDRAIVCELIQRVCSKVTW